MAEREPQRLKEPTYLEIVWGQFRKNRIAHSALYALVGLFILAVIAPLLASDQPLWAWIRFEDSGDTELVFPLFEALLFNGNIFGKGVDIFFNLLLIAIPLALLLVPALRVAARNRPDRPTGKPLHPVALVVVIGVGVLLVTAALLSSRVSVRTLRTGMDWALWALAASYVAILIWPRVASRLSDRGRKRLRRLFRLSPVLLLLVAFGVLLAFQPSRTVTRWKESVGVTQVDGENKDVIFYQTAEGPQRAVLLDAVFTPIPYSYTETSYAISAAAGGEHILGTDESGRDLLVRMLYGTRLSLTIGVIAVSIYVFIGIVLGALAGFLGGWADIIIQRFIEVVMVFPAFILILTFVSFLPSRSIFWIMVIIGLIRWTTVARLVRGEFLRLKQVDFVQAAVAQGLKTSRVIFRHVLPNALGPVLVAATFGVGDAILIEAVLSFLGVSDLDAPSWGRILYVGRSQHSLFTMLLPGIAIFITVSVLNLIGEGLRDALDPKLRK